MRRRAARPITLGVVCDERNPQTLVHVGNHLLDDVVELVLSDAQLDGVARLLEPQVELEERQEQQRKQQATRKPEPKREPSPESNCAGPWPWVVAGVGVAAVGAGAVFGLQAQSTRQDAEDEPVQRKAAETFRDAEDLAGIANVFLIAGAVVTAGGITWIVLDSGTREQPASVALHLNPSGIAVTGRM